MNAASATRSTRMQRAVGGPSSFPVGAFVAGLLLGASWTWWGLKQGAYFTSVFNPGIIVLCAALVLLLWAAPWRARLSLSRPARWCALGLAGLATWTLASALWSPAPDVSVSDAQRVLAYLASFALGAWLCNMLGRRMELALLPVVAAAGIVGVVTVVQLLHSTDLNLMLNSDGTLQYPLGYRNATAAFFLIAVWPALSLAVSRDLDPRLRVLSAAVASLALGLGALCQSRGSFFGIAFALVVYLLASQRRLAALRWLFVAAIPLAIVIPSALDLFQSVNGGSLDGALAPMRDSGRGVLIGVAVTFVLASLLLAVEADLARRKPPGWANPRTGAAFTLIVIVAALFAFTVKVSNPIGWVGDRFDQFEAGEPDLSQGSSRFTLNTGSDRSDIWRVALAAGADDPLFGDGSGGFQYRYLRDRQSVTQLARDAHSVELEMFSELGVPGLLLLVASLSGATLAILRARKLGPGASVLSVGALAAAAYWLGHSSLDWFWSYPAVTAPVFGLIGAACAPTMLDLKPAPRNKRTRVALGVLALVLAASVVPAVLSGRFLENATAEFRTDLPAAYDDLAKARSLNPLSDEPILTEGFIAKRAGDPERAISAFKEAIRKRPEEEAGHLFLADMYAKRQPDLARAEVAAAARLNPLGSRLAPLRARIKRLSSPR